MQLKRTNMICVILTVVSLGAIAAADELVHEVTINAPITDVWDAFTIADEIESWMVPKAHIDLRVGGTLRTAYDAKAELNGPQAIHHRILAYQPQRMLAMQVVKCPEGFEFAEQVEQTWEVIYFEPVAADRTHIRAVGMGYGEGAQWEQMRMFFEQGNAWTYAQLKKKFQDGNAADTDGAASAEQRDPVAALDLLGRLVGGEWIHQSEGPDGGTFRVRNIVTHAPDGSGLVSRGWLGSGDGMHEHGATLTFFDPITEQVRFLNINEQGDIAEGAITTIAEDTLHWDWHIRGQSELRYDIRMKFTGTDEYLFTLTEIRPDGSAMKLIEAGFHRVDELPPAFSATKASPAGVNGR